MGRRVVGDDISRRGYDRNLLWYFLGKSPRSDESNGLLDVALESWFWEIGLPLGKYAETQQ